MNEEELVACPWCNAQLIDTLGWHLSHTVEDCPRGEEWKDLSFEERRAYAEAQREG